MKKIVLFSVFVFFSGASQGSDINKNNAPFIVDQFKIGGLCYEIMSKESESFKIAEKERISACFYYRSMLNSPCSETEEGCTSFKRFMDSYPQFNTSTKDELVDQISQIEYNRAEAHQKAMAAMRQKIQEEQEKIKTEKAEKEAKEFAEKTNKEPIPAAEEVLKQ
jgi:hypothetical protein